MPAALIMKAIQAKLSGSGLDWIKLQSLNISSRNKTINLELTLEGEDKPVQAELRYSFDAEDKIVIRDVLTSRKWMTEAIKLVLLKTGDRFALPGGLRGKMIRVLL